MMLGSACSVAMCGIEAIPVTVEASAGSGLPTIQLVGKADIAVREAVERIRSAFTNLQLPWPRQRVTLSLSPADIPKSGAHYDLAIAVALLQTQDVVTNASFPKEQCAFLGELGLDGRLVPVAGVLPMVLALREKGMTTVYVPRSNYAEAALVPDIEIIGLTCLQQLLVAAESADRKQLKKAVNEISSDKHNVLYSDKDFAEIKGLRQAVQAALIAAAGGHHFLMLGPPGSGKSMIAARMPGILPPLSFEKSLVVTSLHSIVGHLDKEHPLITQPPYVAPHARISDAALLGGGRGLAQPGAVSMAHEGILFLDECTEINGATLDLLRTPLEEGEVRISRSRGTVRYPARFQLVMAGNPCPCGAPNVATCHCSSSVRQRYRHRLSGPLMDRVDIRVRVKPARLSLLTDQPGVSSQTLRSTVMQARERAQRRWGKETSNAAVSSRELQSVQLAPGALLPTHQLLQNGALSARGLQRSVRLAWTLADLKKMKYPTATEIEEALLLRAPMDDVD